MRGARASCADGRAFPADLVVVGIGAVPNDELAREAGLEVDNGIVVDELGRTSDPAIFAAGDVTNHPNGLFDRRLRLESVHNAMAQAKAVAAAISGRPESMPTCPGSGRTSTTSSCRSPGVVRPATRLLRGDPASRAFSCLHMQDGRLIAIDAINRGADFWRRKR